MAGPDCILPRGHELARKLLAYLGLGGGPSAKEPPHDHQLPQVVGGVVEHQEQLAEVRMIGAVRRDGEEIDPRVSRQFLEPFAILADGRDAPLPGLRVRRFGRWRLVAGRPFQLAVVRGE